MRINIKKLLKLPVMEIANWNKITGEVVFTGAKYRSKTVKTLCNSEFSARLVL